MDLELFDFPSNYSFGLELEFYNKSQKDVDIMCLQNDLLLLMDDKVLKELDDNRRYLSLGVFAFKNRIKDYFLYHYEETNKDNVDLGVEISTPILYNNKEYLGMLKQLLEILKKENFLVNECSSVHIHSGVNPFLNSYDKLLNFFLFYIYFEPVFYKLSAMGNFGHIREYAISYSYPVSLILDTTFINLDTLKKYIMNNYGYAKKTNALHFKNFDITTNRYNSSFEIRTFNGTTDYFVIKNYIRAFLNSIYYSVSDNFNKLEYLDKCRKVLEKRQNTLFCSFLKFADDLVDEFVNVVFKRDIDKASFLEQINGSYLKKELTPKS